MLLSHICTLPPNLSLSLSLLFKLCLFLVQAIDGFLIVLDKEANILYVSETIAGHVGLIQVSSNVYTFIHITFTVHIHVYHSKM